MARGWNNENYLTTGFRTSNPSTGEVINALYGDLTGGVDKTIYTDYRTGVSCTGMSVVYLTAGVDTIPSTLVTRTIYVLAPGKYIRTNSIAMNACSAIVGSSGDVQLYASRGNSYLSYLIATFSNSKNIIIDNIKFDGYNDGTGTTHPNISYGIYGDKINNSTINNISLENFFYGMYLVNGSFRNKISNVRSYSNISYGIRQYYSVIHTGNNLYNNIITFNNLNYGMSIEYSTHNTVNNIQSFNN
jgi:hypothetical protein